VIGIDCLGKRSNRAGTWRTVCFSNLPYGDGKKKTGPGGGLHVEKTNTTPQKQKKKKNKKNKKKKKQKKKTKKKKKPTKQSLDGERTIM